MKTRTDVVGAIGILKDIIPQLEQVSEYEDINKVVEFSRTCNEYTNLKTMSGAARNLAAKTFMRAERKLGELLAQIPPTRGVTEARGKISVYEEFGMNRMRASRAQKLAAVPNDEFDDYLEVCEKDGFEPSVTGALTYTTQSREVTERISQMLKFKETATKQFDDIFKFRKDGLIRDDKFDVIITTTPLTNLMLANYWKLSKAIIIANNHEVDEVLMMMKANKVKFRCIIMVGASSTKNENAKMTSTWCPAIVFGKPNDWLTNDKLSSGHKEITLREQIELLILSCTNENDIIFDPFMKTSDTAVAAISTSRRFIGCPHPESSITEKVVRNDVKKCLIEVDVLD